MRQYRFHHVDVVAEAPLEGHPLGVFPDARGLAIRQGVEMRRRSRLDVPVDGREPDAMAVRRAGRVEPVITGTVAIPG